MSPLLTYFWPIFAVALVLGAIGGSLWLRRSKRTFLIASGVIALAFTGLWHGPLGGAGRFIAQVEPAARFILVDWEMPQVQAPLHRGPLTRRLMLSGQADEFQREELVRIMSMTPGVSRATWDTSGGVPMILEGLAVAIAGFLIGLLLAYVVELRRRYNSQWSW
ncbi:hypothetical protein H8M03_10140 [Sphingomonas sabuli]|uniref:Uncharacterized protein n=1 Tax=Sphingomonas sabuli TaxID=2764186 RepID=A0A7G9L168_9SPHN|nr:hypothetical protein [Sphingomonas sabuli]QNM82367.1 hypothetical protein H8M03_10140 [Sphingomonas sabuli]